MALKAFFDRRVSVILPSSWRVERLVSCVERLWATVRGFDVECIVVTEDPETRTRMGGIYGSDASDASDYLDESGVRVIELPQWFGEWRPRALEAWNLGASVATGTVLVLGADDLWWFHGWIGEMLEQMAGFPDGEGMVGFNDLHHDGNKLSTHFAVGRQFAVETLGGCLVCPRYQHFYVDQEAMARAKRAGRFSWASNAVVEHLHPAFQTAPTDRLYEGTKRFFEADSEMFLARARLGWPDDFEPVLVRAVGYDRSDVSDGSDGSTRMR